MRFLEEAGEVQQAHRLTGNQALLNAAKEAELQKVTATGAKPPRGAAPQLPLALLPQLEEWVLDDSKPLFQRGFAWFRLVRH